MKVNATKRQSRASVLVALDSSDGCASRAKWQILTKVDEAAAHHKGIRTARVKAASVAVLFATHRRLHLKQARVKTMHCAPLQKGLDLVGMIRGY